MRMTVDQPDPSIVDGYWALRAKEPGDWRDYRILRSSSGPFDMPAFEHAISELAVGNPVERPSTARGSLPWVSLGPVQLNGKEFVGVAYRALTPESDRDGRPIAETWYVAVERAPLERIGATYTSLYLA